MSRVQLALRVADLEASIAFYSRLFAIEPAKRREGYANFAVTEPPLKLVLIEGEAGEETRLDHLGVEVATTDEGRRRMRLHRLTRTGPAHFGSGSAVDDVLHDECDCRTLGSGAAARPARQPPQERNPTRWRPGPHRQLYPRGSSAAVLTCLR